MAKGSQVSVKEVDLNNLLQSINKINSQMARMDNAFAKINDSISGVGRGFDKVTKGIQNANKGSNQLVKTLQKMHGTMRFMAMIPFGKIFALGVGAISSVVSSAKDAVGGTLNDSALARGGQTTLTNLRAFDRGAALSGIENLISKQDISSFRERMNDTEFAGAMAHLGSVLGMNRDSLNNADTTDLMVKSLQGIDKYIKENGGYNNLAANALTKATGMLDLLGVDMQTLRSGDWGEFSQNYNAQKKQGINAKTFARAEKEFLKLGYAWKDLKDMLIRTAIPTISTFTNKMQDVLKKVVSKILDSGIIDRIGNGLGALADKMLDYDFDKIINKIPDFINWVMSVASSFKTLGGAMNSFVNFFTQTMPNAFSKIMYFLTDTLSTITFGETSAGFKLAAAAHNLNAQGYDEMRKNAIMNYAINSGIGIRNSADRDRRIAESINNAINGKIKVEVIMKNEDGSVQKAIQQNVSMGGR